MNSKLWLITILSFTNEIGEKGICHFEVFYLGLGLGSDVLVPGGAGTVWRP